MNEDIQRKTRKRERKGKTLLYRERLRENLAAVHPHPHPSADSETELSVKGALESNLWKGRRGSRVGRGEVQWQCVPGDGVSDPRGLWH